MPRRRRSFLRAIALAALGALIPGACSHSDSPTDACKVVSVSVNPGAQTITSIGGAISLTVSAAGRLGALSAADAAVTWGNDASSVVSVQGNGTTATVQALAAGTAHVTATTCGGVATATITVAPGVVRGVTVTGAGTPLRPGATATLTAVVDADAGVDPAVTWSSSNTAVASVSSGGVVTAGGTAGTARITATSVYDPTKSGFVDVTVSIPQTATTWTPTRVSVGAGGLTGDVYGLWGTSAANVYAATVDGDVFRYDGNQWQVALANKGRFRAVHGSDTSNVFAVGYDLTAATGMAWHFDGTTWVAQTLPTNGELLSVYAVGPSEAFAVGAGGTIVHYVNGAWVTMPAPQISADLWAVWGSGPSDVFAVGSGGTIAHYNGTDWTTQSAGTPANLWSVWGSGPSNVFAVGSGGTILRYDGATWSPVSSPATRSLFGLSGASGSDVFAVGEGGTLLHYDGVSWTQNDIGPGTNLALFSVWDAGGGAAVMGGQRGFTASYRAGAATVLSLNPSHLGVAMSGPTNAFVVGEFSNIFHFDGAAWTAMPSPGQGYLEGVWTADAATAVAVGAGGLILRFDGTTWTSVPSPTAATLYDVAGGSISDLTAVGDAGVILRFDGTTWTSVGSGTTKDLHGVTVAGSTAFAVGAGGTILRRTGTGWSAMAAPVPNDTLLAVWAADTSTAFAVGTAGTILRLANGAWTPMTANFGGTLFGVWGASATDVYAVGEGGVILRYDGTSWAPMPSGTRQSLYAVAGRPGVGAIAVGAGSVVVRGTSAGSLRAAVRATTAPLPPRPLARRAAGMAVHQGSARVGKRPPRGPHR